MAHQNSFCWVKLNKMYFFYFTKFLILGQIYRTISLLKFMARFLHNKNFQFPSSWKHLLMNILSSFKISFFPFLFSLDPPFSFPYQYYNFRIPVSVYFFLRTAVSFWKGISIDMHATRHLVLTNLPITLKFHVTRHLFW